MRQACESCRSYDPVDGRRGRCAIHHHVILTAGDWCTCWGSVTTLAPTVRAPATDDVREKRRAALAKAREAKARKRLQVGQT